MAGHEMRAEAINSVSPRDCGVDFLRFCGKKKIGHGSILLVLSQETVSWVYARHFETVCTSTSKSRSHVFSGRVLVYETLE